MMQFGVTLADNGYIVKSDDALLVYNCQEPSMEMLEEICGELLHEINQGSAPKFIVKIKVEPINEE